MATDPTRTKMIRRNFEREAVRRFKRLRRAIRDVIIERQGFGPAREPVINLGEFDFPRSSQKISSFMQWLREQQDIDILPADPDRDPADAWPSVYVDSAYQRGIRRGRAELRRQGVEVPEDTPLPGIDPVQAAFNQPFHVDRVGLIYTRVLNELEGITQEMDRQISRVLADGMARGANPIQIANDITDRVNKIGITRARMLARTEVIRAHHSANIAEYRRAGVDEVRVVAEWVTAGDDRVCPACQALEGKKFKIDAIENAIPLHPNCRCVAVPVLSEDIDNRQVRRKRPNFRKLINDERRAGAR